MLGERLEGVRKRVERNGERDRERRRRVGRRLKMLWVILGCWGALALVLGVLRHWPGVGVDVRGGRVVELGNRTVDAALGVVLSCSSAEIEREKGVGGGTTTASRSEGLVQTSKTPLVEDPIIRLFDEL